MRLLRAIGGGLIGVFLTPILILALLPASFLLWAFNRHRFKEDEARRSREFAAEPHKK